MHYVALTLHTHTTHTLHPLTGSGRVDGNKKGILTRQRQPKAAARLVRQRYLSLAAGVGGGVCTDHDLLGLTQKRVYVQ